MIGEHGHVVRPPLPLSIGSAFGTAFPQPQSLQAPYSASASPPKQLLLTACLCTALAALHPNLSATLSSHRPLEFFTNHVARGEGGRKERAERLDGLDASHSHFDACNQVIPPLNSELSGSTP
ncbi:hypothetical protein FIBSPDRAFT_547527 [Athelia psychrophila]|uniref:Uncharacterized protein n=1 Tax=Athelia psychrophila TaxID=1759441 RepID=A0A166IS10_9AGAM|nr:hypothetical protein FIBSPDRAFT_547527 [Fibularhizoctonia sp. CBS 109695]